MKIATPILLAAFFLAVTPPFCRAADSSRQDVVRDHSADVMPFEMQATTHIFTKTSTGGIQRVVAKEPSDAKQAELIRAHLQDIADQFGRRNVAGPSQVHGAGMPGLAALKAASPGELRLQYRDVKFGAEVEYVADNPKLVAVVHEWFDAQLSDHGTDAIAGHNHSMQHSR